MNTKKLGRVHTALRIAPGITVLILLVLASSGAGPVLAASGSGDGGGGTPPPPPDFVVGVGGIGDVGLGNFLVRGGLPTCPAYYGCGDGTFNLPPGPGWEPRTLAIPELGFVGYTVNRVNIFSRNGFAGTVTLEVINLPVGVTSQTATSVTVAANSAVTTPFMLQAAVDAPLGDHVVTVRATSGTLVHEATFKISIVDHLPAPHPQVSMDNGFLDVVGGGQYGASVKISAPAPAGGLVSFLSVEGISPGDPAVVTVPASVTIPEGATSASFIVTTPPVTVIVGQSIGAKIGADGWRGATTLRVVSSAALSQVNLFPTSVVGGNSSAVTVSLSAAVAEPTVVSLSSSNPAIATVPATVTVPAGSSSTFAPISTAKVTESTTVAISATFGGVTKTAFLGVTAAAPTPPPPGGTITLKLAQYDTAKQTLQVEVTDSTGASQTLTVFVTSTSQVIGTLTGAGTFKGQFNWPVNPGTITVASSLGWSMTADVVAK